MIYVGDQRLELAAQKPAQQRHQGLKTTEIDAAEQRMFPLELSHGQSLTDRHRKSVHTQRQSQKQEIK